MTWGDGDEDQAVLSRMSPRTSAENGSNWKYHVSCPPSIVPSLLSSCGTWDVLENGDPLTDTAFKNHPHTWTPKAPDLLTEESALRRDPPPAATRNTPQAPSPPQQQSGQTHPQAHKAQRSQPSLQGKPHTAHAPQHPRTDTPQKSPRPTSTLPRQPQLHNKNTPKRTERRKDGREERLTMPTPKTLLSPFASSNNPTANITATWSRTCSQLKRRRL